MERRPTLAGAVLIGAVLTAFAVAMLLVPTRGAPAKLAVPELDSGDPGPSREQVDPTPRERDPLRRDEPQLLDTAEPPEPTWDWV